MAVRRLKKIFGVYKVIPCGKTMCIDWRDNEMRNKNNPKKEKFIMLASSVLVLSALTLTGVYVKERTRIQDENSAELSGTEEMENVAEAENEEKASPANVGTAVIPQVDDALESDFGSYQARLEEEENLKEEQTEEMTEEESLDNDSAAAVNAPGVTLSFSPEEGLVWPIVGKVLINYSMDKTVYFPTLAQYKYNPAIVIQATEGETITAAADGKVSGIYNDAQLGNCVQVDLGDGYELTYGQLGNIDLKEGDYMEVGDVIGTVAAPTKYFSTEGANVYFKLTLNGEPVDPLNTMS